MSHILPPVLRSQNLGMLRPERSWRPIITLEVDGQHKHEVMLGVDGQNPNQREIMLLYVLLYGYPIRDLTSYSHRAHHQSQIKLDVWHKSQSKAKSRKRRHLVASTSMALGEVIKKQGTEPCAPPSITLSHVLCLSPPDVELCLSGIPAARRKSIAQKHQPCASLLIRFRPPRSAMSSPVEHEHESDRFSIASSGE